MATSAEDGLRFVPSAVEGLPAVTEAAVFPDRLELVSDGRRVVFRFLDIAQWHRRGWLYRHLVFAQFTRMPFPVKQHETPDPPGVSIARFVPAEMRQCELKNLIEQAWRWRYSHT